MHTEYLWCARPGRLYTTKEEETSKRRGSKPQWKEKENYGESLGELTLFQTTVNADPINLYHNNCEQHAVLKD